MRKAKAKEAIEPAAWDVQARAKIAEGESALRVAAEIIAEAKATLALNNVAVGEALGKSEAWVRGLLKWRDAGYPETPFGPAAKKARTSKSTSSTDEPAGKDEGEDGEDDEEAGAEPEERTDPVGALQGRIAQATGATPDTESPIAKAKRHLDATPGLCGGVKANDLIEATGDTWMALAESLHNARAAIDSLGALMGEQESMPRRAAG